MRVGEVFPRHVKDSKSADITMLTLDYGEAVIIRRPLSYR